MTPLQALRWLDEHFEACFGCNERGICDEVRTVVRKGLEGRERRRPEDPWHASSAKVKEGR